MYHTNREKHRRTKGPPGILAIALILALVGCLARPPEPTERPPQVTASPTFSTVSPQTPGTLAYIGADGNVWTTSPAEGWTRQVTRDATAPPEGQGRSYHRLVWLRDGSLAFAAVVRSRDDASSEIFLHSGQARSPQRIAADDEHFVIYLHGPPASCSERPACPLLAYLIEEQNGVGLHLITTGKSAPQDLLVAAGRPFYFSWSPDGEQILWHSGGAARDNPAAEIGLYHIQEDRHRILPFAPGMFLAPIWSSQDEHWFAVTASDGRNRLQRIASDEATTLVTTAGQEIVFVRAPDGGRVAYAVRESDTTPFYGPVQLIDLATGEIRQVTKDAFAILAFFWSPDGRRLAYLSRLDLPDTVWMQWRLVDLASDRDRGFTAFHPSPLMRFIVHSFNQYAQSHRFWSPDGRYLVYADRDGASVDRVWLVDTEAEKGADPILVDQGSIGIWSWR